MGVVIDSSVLINLERRGLSATTLLQYESEDLALSAVTISELMFGWHRAATAVQRNRRQAFLDDALRNFLVLAFDLAVAREHARIWADLVTTGQSIGSHDSMIAATALAHHHSVLTDNVREFSRVAGLEVRRPPW